MGLLGSIAGFALGGLTGGGAVLGAKSQRKAAKKAAAFSQTATDANNALAGQVYQQSTNALAPYTQAGNPAGTQLNALLGLGGEPAQTQAFDNFRNSSGYNFIRDETLNGVNSAYAGRGTLQSGAAMQALQDRAGQVATVNAFQPYMQLLDNQQRLGLSATLGQAGLGQSYVGTVSGNNWMNADNQANAALVRGQNNPFAAFAGSMSGLAQSALGGGLRF